MTTDQNRRRFHRFPFEARAFLTIGTAKSLPCDLVDLSISGALVSLSDPLEPVSGCEGELGLVVTGLVRGDRVDIIGRVDAVWQQGNQLGCRFIGVDADSFAHLKTLIEDNLGDPMLLDRELTQLDYWPGVESASTV